jgi:hypothetical protein
MGLLPVGRPRTKGREGLGAKEVMRSGLGVRACRGRARGEAH